MKTSFTNNAWGQQPPRPPVPQTSSYQRRREVSSAPARGAMLVALAVNCALAEVRYVDPNNADHATPYTSWATAARTIQQAVDVATAGDQIIVTNGTYAMGGRTVQGTQTNRVVVDKPVTVRSVNGPEFTEIRGYQVPGATNGDGAIRGVYLADGASLIGFTVSGGATRTEGDYEMEQDGGGVWCQSSRAFVSNCILTGNSATFDGGGIFSGTVSDSILTNNWAYYGGGAFGAILNHCTLTENSAASGGGAGDDDGHPGILESCLLSHNSARDAAGGARGCTLNHCSLVANTASIGGGTDLARLNHCLLVSNTATSSGGGALNSQLDYCTLTNNSAASGGGAASATLNNCVLIDNAATANGGGADLGILNNCTLCRNSAPMGGGAYNSVLTNCILYFNNAPAGANFDTNTVLSYCCATPLPSGAEGNIDRDPLFVDRSNGDLRLQSDSPCIDAGNTSTAKGWLDVEGNPRMVGAGVDIGAYEFQGPGSAPVIAAQPANRAAFATDNVGLEVLVLGTQPLRYQWSFQGSVLSGATNSFLMLAQAQVAQSGAYSVSITNELGSVASSNALVLVYAAAPNQLHYARADSATPRFPYTNWITAASTIQEAIDASLPPDQVIVSNGVYASGGRAIVIPTMLDPFVPVPITNRVSVDKAILVRSVNGPQFTVIEGYQVPATTNGLAAIRCVYLTNGASLAGFTLTNGATQGATFLPKLSHGGGLWCESVNEVVSNCVLTGNSAACGGGAYQGTFTDCTLVGNSAGGGGGASMSTLNHCRLVANWAGTGGGCSGSTLNHCTLTGNQAGQGGGSDDSILNSCLLAGAPMRILERRHGQAEGVERVAQILVGRGVEARKPGVQLHPGAHQQNLALEAGEAK